MTQEQQMPTTGRYGWYEDHNGRQRRRASKLLDYGQTKPGLFHLHRWEERQVAEGLAQRDDLIGAVKAMGRPPRDGWTKAQKEALNTLTKQAKEAAKTRDGAVEGTSMHGLTERLDRGEELETICRGLAPDVSRTLRAYEALRRLNGWQVVEIERTIVLDDLEVAGTFDRIDFVPGLHSLLGPGECQYGASCAALVNGGHTSALPAIVDVKTEGDPTLNGVHIAPQLAIYSRAREMWEPDGSTKTIVDSRGQEREVPGGRYVPTPCVRQDVAIVVHLRDGDANPLFVNLHEGWEAACAFYEQMKRENRAKRRMGAAGAWFAPMPGIKTPAPAELLVADAAARDLASPYRPTALDRGALVEDGVTEVAVTGVDGTVRWGPEAQPLGMLVQAGSSQQLIAAVWQAADLPALGAVWQAARDAGVSWGGALAMAGDARRRQIECPQRPLHIGTGKCACGWMSPGLA